MIEIVFEHKGRTADLKAFVRDFPTEFDTFGLAKLSTFEVFEVISEDSST